MSIYPVRLSAFHSDDHEMALIAKGVLSYNWCHMCGNVPPWRSAIADHSLAWGYYHEIFCNTRCQKEYWALRESLRKP